MKSLNVLVSVIATALATGCYGGKIIAERVDEPTVNHEVIAVDDAGAGVAEQDLEQALVDRWNAVPLATQEVDDGGMIYTFVWPTFGEFPHPTFKGGGVIAYQAFANVLLAFMQTGDNFDFLASNTTERDGVVCNLFDLLIGEAAAYSGRVEVGWTFRELVTLFAFDTNRALATVEPATRSGLAELATKMP